ncbi:zf-TFIIB domain-containing protein [Amycolatopsis sp. FBCC-B4732]|uniref:TFIIB-type zinc ribbon-containing protein n=1 Tax=Amycolatopsis sp. FBCC-B4732 TaxID=3079339 RepID=UPI00248CA2D4|nr:zf-TFIIB domain-containing protein [Amycolatopsis sp. FBCC-B4732]
MCPKCQNQMRTVDKNGIHIDQCDGCRGIFLDRGELEAIVGAESSFYGGQPPQYQSGPTAHHGRPDSPRPYRGGHPDSPKGYRGGYSDSPRPHRGGYSDSPRPHRGGYSDSPRPYGHGHRKRSFLENLFD